MEDFQFNSLIPFDRECFTPSEVKRRKFGQVSRQKRYVRFGKGYGRPNDCFSKSSKPSGAQ